MSYSDSAMLAELVTADSLAGQTVGLNFFCSQAKKMVIKIPSMLQRPDSALGIIKDVSTKIRGLRMNKNISSN